MPTSVIVRQDGTGDYTTIMSGCAAVDAMGTVYIGSGTYTEYINLTQQIAGGWFKPVRLIAESTSSRPIINGSTLTASAITADAVAQSANTASLYCESLIFVSCSHANGVFKLGGNRSVYVKKCEFRECDTTILKNAFSDATYLAIFEQNYCYNVDGIFNGVVGSYCRVYNNYAYFNQDNVALSPGGANSFVFNNTFIFNNGGSYKGIVAGKVINNIVVNRSGAGWTAIEATTGSYNCLSGSWSAGVSATVSTGNITTNPLFQNSTLSAGTASLSSSSPCINAGFDLSLFFTTDIIGTSRTGSFDIGAYEYVSVASNPWGSFSSSSYADTQVISNGILINKNKNAASHFVRRSGLSSQNGLTEVQNIPYVLSVPGPISLKLRTKPATTTTNVSGNNTPNGLGY